MDKTHKDKLDRVFSEYIRKRDTKDGYFICISCGRRLPYGQADCGHYINRRHLATRWDEENCNAQCRKCITPENRVLMEDLTWKEIGKIGVGEKIVGFEEYGERKTSRRYKIGVVTRSERFITDVYKVTFENGESIKCTANHKWLARRGSTTSFVWIETKDLWVDSYNLKGNHITGACKGHVFSVVCKPFRVVEQDMSADAGWIAGMIDADGHLTQQIARDKRHPKRITYGLRCGISQGDGIIAERVDELLQRFSDKRVTCRADIPKEILNNKRGKKYVSKVTVRTYLITGTNVEKLEFLQRIRPLKLNKLDINKIGKVRSQYDTKVVSIEYVGKEVVVDLETDCHTYIAEGYAMHNCNRFDEGNIQGYRRGLVRKIGEQHVILLESRKYRPTSFSNFEADVLIAEYQRLIKELNCK